MNKCSLWHVATRRPEALGNQCGTTITKMGEDYSGVGIAICEDYVIIRDAVDIATVRQNDRSVFGRRFKDGITVLGHGIFVRFGMDLDANTFWSRQDILRLIIRLSMLRINDRVLQ